MAKKYTKTEWARIQSRLPEEDRVPYSQSPDKPVAPSAAASQESGTIGAASIAANMPAPAPAVSAGFDPAAFRIAEEKSMGATPPAGVASAFPFTPTAATIPADSASPTLTEPVPTTQTGPTGDTLPPGFIAGPFPKELERFFGAPPANILGYKINQYTNKNGETYYKLSISQKGAYGQALYGSSEFGAPITKDASGNWVLFQGDYSNGTGGSSSEGKSDSAAETLAAQQAAQAAAEEKRRQGQSAYALLFSEFERYGLGALVEPLKGFIVEGLSPAEFTLRLRETDAYKKRFAANQARIQKGLRALSEAEYIGLEDQYQDVMRRYGLPDTYYNRGDMGRQEGFEKFIGGDVSPVELEDRIQTAQRRVINAAPEVTASLRSFYPEIGQGDLLAYFLDPEKAIENIKRKVTAAEIGGAATIAGLATGATRAEELARYGVTQEQARQGFQTIAQVLPRGSQLAEIYKQSPYTQTTAEQEVFGLAGAPEAERQRRRLAQLEQAAFTGSSGMAGGALGRERAGAI